MNNGKNVKLETRSSTETFSHAIGDVVLVRWSDERIYYAKIKTINKNRQTCQVMFEDNRRGTAEFDQIHAVDSVVEDWIACIVCKFGTSDAPNQIVLCDECGVAFHQRCHHPHIPDSALELSAPWACIFCIKDKPNPYLKEVEENTPLFAEDIPKQQLRRQAPSSKADSDASQHTTTEGEAMELNGINDETDGATSEDSSTNNDLNSDLASESEDPESVLSPIGKRRQSAIEKDPLYSPEVPEKRCTTNNRGSSSRRSGSLQDDGSQMGQNESSPPTTDSKRAAAYAQWKRDRLQSTKSEDRSTEDKLRESKGEERVVRSAAPINQEQEDRKDDSQTSTSTTRGTSRRSARKATPRRYYPATVPMSNTATIQHIPYHYVQQQQAALAYANHTDGSDILKGDFPRPLPLQRIQPTKANLPLTSLAEQFQHHFDDFVNGFQQAQGESPNSQRGQKLSSESEVCCLGNPLFGSTLHGGRDSRRNRLPQSAQVKRTDSSADRPVQSSKSHTIRNGDLHDKSPWKQTTKGKNACAGCGENALPACSRCENVWYCSEECQERSYMVFCKSCTCFD